MAWKINFTKSAEKEFSKLPSEIRILVVSYLRGKVMLTPREYGKALVTSNRIKLWRYRIQNYRIICQINDMER